MTLEDYKKELDKHDWFYGMSEDSSIYKKGLYNESRLRDLTRLSKDHKETFEKKKNETLKAILK